MMSYEEKNITEEKINRQSWWKKLLGLNPTYKLTHKQQKGEFLLFKYLFLILEYVFVYSLKIIEDYFGFLYTKSTQQKKYLIILLQLWLDKYNDTENNNEYLTVSEEISKIIPDQSYSKINYKHLAEYFFTNKMFNLASIFYTKYYSGIFNSERYYYKAYCLIERIRNDYFYTNNKNHILNIYINILRIIAWYYLKISLLLSNDNYIKFNIYKNLGILSISIKSNKQAEYYFDKARNINPNDSLILNNLALLYCTKDKISAYKDKNENMFNSIKYIHSAIEYSTENNRERVFFNLIRILKHYNKKINTKKYKNILYELKFNDLICCSYIAKDYESISTKETAYCMKNLSKIIIKNLYQQIIDYKYIKIKNIPKKYLKEYKYYMIYNTYLIFYHLNKLDLLKYFLFEEVKLSGNLKKDFIDIIESRI